MPDHITRDDLGLAALACDKINYRNVAAINKEVGLIIAQMHDSLRLWWRSIAATASTANCESVPKSRSSRNIIVALSKQLAIHARGLRVM